MTKVIIFFYIVHPLGMTTSSSSSLIASITVDLEANVAIACHKVYIGERNLEVGGALRHAGVNDCVWGMQHDRIQHKNITFHRHI